MKINYFFRHPNIGHSIHRVFRTLIEEIGKSNEVQIYEVPSQGSMPRDVIKNNCYVYKKRDRKAIHHITGHIHDVLLALMGVKTVLTIHDLVFLDNVKNPFKKIYKWLFWLFIPIKIANKVVCISNQTKSNILSKISTNKLVVIYNAVDPIYCFKEKSFNKAKPVILHIGTGWNKNLKNTILALENISCSLRIIGKLNPEQLALLKQYDIEYSNAFDLTDEEIKNEYVNCDIVNFPSVYEGFGMPIIEGQKTGRVIITSKIEPIVEVATCEAAALVDPYDYKNMRTVYLNVINNDQYRDSLIKEGIENAKRFSVENIAQQYLELYKET